MERDFHDERFDDRSIEGTRQQRSQALPTTERTLPESLDRIATRTTYEVRDKKYRLNDREARMLTDIGKFRTIEKGDLLRRIYKGDKDAFDGDLRHLHRQNLVRITGSKGSLQKYIALTNPAKQLVETHLRANSEQRIYSGVVKIRELKHDATLYRLYETVTKEMEERGEKPLRVVLDYEFKRNINKALANNKNLSWLEKQRRIREVAQAQKLKVVNNRIPVPDLRVEYERPDGEHDVRDLEYVTKHYRARSFAEKAAAGFTMYGDEKRGRAPYGPDLIGGLIAL
jgi:hypothetical protein